MSSLTGSLPEPRVKSRATAATTSSTIGKSQLENSKIQCTAPKYGQRYKWRPRTQADFGDGGAFPEVHLAQYPQGIGKKKMDAGKTLALKVDKDGKVAYDAIVKQDSASTTGRGGASKVFHTTIAQMKRKDVLENDVSLVKPDQDELQATAEATQQALSKIVNVKTAALKTKQAAATKAEDDQYIRYTPAQQGSGFNSGAKQRIIRMVEAPVDPLQPPKFKHKKVPQPPPSPPPPVMHSPPRKITKEEQAAFNIPPCVSNWKNIHGYTVPLEKRLVDGRGLQEKEINMRFAEFSNVLAKTTQQVAEGMKVRRELENELRRQEKERKEQELLRKAAQARNERAGIRDEESSESSESEDEVEAKERDNIRNDRHYDRQRDRRLKKASVEKQKAVKGRDRERDISEQIALGKSIKTSTTGENAFDQRLFDKSQGMSSGFGGGDDAYNVYDKPLFNSTNETIYKAKKNDDMYGDDDIAKLKKNRFTSESRGGGRDGPVQFEQERKEEEDVFGLDAVLFGAMKDSNDKGQTRGGRSEVGRSKTMVASAGDRETLRSSAGGGHRRKKLDMVPERGANDTSSTSKRPRY